MELVFRPRTAYNSRNFTVSYCLYANWVSKWLCGHSKKQELNKVLFTNLYYHINITNITMNVINFYIYIYILRALGLKVTFEVNLINPQIYKQGSELSQVSLNNN